MGQIFVWTLSDIFGIAAAVLIFGVLGIVSSATWWRNVRCKHDGKVNETAACDAICRKCGKNLGFIGSWHGRHGDDVGN